LRHMGNLATTNDLAHDLKFHFEAHGGPCHDT
jgi:hypothetical protein